MSSAVVSTSAALSRPFVFEDEADGEVRSLPNARQVPEEALVGTATLGCPGDPGSSDRCVSAASHFLAAAIFPLPALLPFLSKRSNTAATISGNPTVASTKTSPNLPPSAGGTNFPQDIASL